MRSFGGFLLILFVSILFHNSAFACIPAVSIKYIVKHRLENFDSDLDISEPVRIAKEDLEDFFSNDEGSGSGFRNSNRVKAPAQGNDDENVSEKPGDGDKTTEKPEKKTTKKPEVVTEKPGDGDQKKHDGFLSVFPNVVCIAISTLIFNFYMHTTQQIFTNL